MYLLITTIQIKIENNSSTLEDPRMCPLSHYPPEGNHCSDLCHHTLVLLFCILLVLLGVMSEIDPCCLCQ